MARKVVPGSITEPYKIGQGDFSPNLVGQQFVQGTPLFTLGNFAITTNTSGVGISKVYNTGSFSESYTLDTLNLTLEESETLSNESIKLILNLDPTNLERYVYFGSFYDFISATIKSILLKWKGSLYVNFLLPDDPTQTPRNTVLDYTYDSVNNKSYFKIPVSTTTNNYALVYDSQYGGNNNPLENQNTIFNPNNESYGQIYNLNLHFGEYQISNDFGDFFVTNFTGSTSTDPYIYVEVNDNAWPPLETTGFGSYNYHLRPQEEVLNKYFFNLLSDFEKQIVNQLTTPQYTFNLQSPKKTDKGTIMLALKKLTWPTSDGYNLDNGGGEFQIYLSSWLNEASDFDNLKTDLIARRFVTGSIIDFDTDGGGNEVYGRKVNKLLRIYGREFDEIKKYIDGISFARIVTYNKRDNTPDELIKILAGELGLDVLLSFFDNSLFKNVLPGNTTQEGYGNLITVPFSGYSRNLSPQEMDVELWRRLVINAWWLFKSKGHRKVLEFFLNLFKIQECVISLDEYIYIAENSPLDVDETLNKIANYLEVAPEDLTASDYPMDIYGYPSVFPNRLDYYYQLNGFWYNGGNLSEVGNNPHLGPYDYGKAYLASLDCFIEDFNGSISGTTTFTTIDNLFTDYENGTIENGLNNFGESYAEIINDTNRTSNNINVSLAGADNQVSFGDSQQSFRMIFSVKSNNDCEIPCPESFINYGNGVIFIGISESEGEDQEEPPSPTQYTYVNESDFPTLFEENPQVLIEALTIDEVCCTEIGGYYLPNQFNDLEIPEDVFTINELFLQQSNVGESVPVPRNACYWCPPTKVLCGLDYYTNIINPPTTRQQNADPEGDKDVIGCTDPTAINFRVDATISCGPNGPYSPGNCSGGAPAGVTCSGCCYKNNTQSDPNGDLEIVTNPCTGELSQTPDGNFLINGNPVLEECCTEGVLGQPVEYVNKNCRPLVTQEVTLCDPENIIIGNSGIVEGVTDPQCCSIDVVGQPVFWDGFNCRVIDENFCVILTRDDQNITNAKCCELKGGYLSTDINGNIICLQNSTQTGEPIDTGGSTDVSVIAECSKTDLLTLQETVINSDTGDYLLLTDKNGNRVSEACCTEYANQFGDDAWYYDVNLGGCVKQNNVTYEATRYQLIESFMGETSLFQSGTDTGIYSLLERIFVEIKTLKVNGIDYLQTSPYPSTIIDPTVKSPNDWNTVLFLQKVFNDFGLTNYKAQLPGTPINVDIPTDTVGLETDSFKDGYGFYIIGPKGETFEIDIQFYTQSTPPPAGVFIFNWYRTSSALLNDPTNTRFIPAEPGYSVDRTISPINEKCFTITKSPYGSEPKQCYPYTIDGKTYE